MGNVPISCCRSKSPRLNRNHSNSRESSRNGSNTQYSYNDYQEQHHHAKFSDKQLARHGEEYEPSYILQHISEREPDDSETDPSSNPFNRPIFATRSSNKNTNNNNNNNDNNNSKFNQAADTHNNQTHNNSAIRKQIISPISSGSQDNGYNSNATTSTNLTQHDGPQLNDSFDEKSITKEQKQEHMIRSEGNQSGDKSLFLSSQQPPNINETLQSLAAINRLPTTREFDITGHFNGDNILKASSCSTIYIDESTISQPDLEQTIKCVSLAIYCHIRNRTSDSCAEIFDESIHPLKMPLETNDQAKSSNSIVDELITMVESEKVEKSSSSLDEPDRKTIYNFVKTLFKAAQLSSEYAITTLVYLERLMTYAEMDLSPKTWRRMFLGAILLSSKVWEDQAVWNVDYAQILEDITVEDINELERQFLELIQFNMNVPSSVYAKYYFHLRTLAFKNGLIRQQKLLTIGNAKALEAMSRVNSNDWHTSPIHRKPSTPKLNRYVSFERTRLNGLSKAILM